MNEVEKLIEIYQKVEAAGLMVTAGKKDAAELMVSHDVVPVVRCKDCVRYNTKGCASGFGWCEGYDRGMMDYDFCSHGAKMDGERRTDAN